MKPRSTLRLLTATILSLLIAQSAIAQVEEKTDEGKITLTTNAETAVEIKTGEMGQFILTPHLSEFFGNPIIENHIVLVNKTGERRQMTCLLTFYDRDKKLIGTCAFTSCIEPQGATQWGNSQIFGKKEDLQRAVAYRLYTCSYPIPPEAKAKN